MDKKNITTELDQLHSKILECKSNPYLKDLDTEKQYLQNKIGLEDFFKDKKKVQEVYARMSVIDKYVYSLNNIIADIEDSLELCEMVEDDDEMTLNDLSNSVLDLKNRVDEFVVKLLLRGDYDNLNCIVEINAGAGGQDAQEWVGVLYRMYKLYCSKQGWSVIELDSSVVETGGYKGVSFLVRGDFVYGYLKAEKGVHRLVRISPFDSSGRRHTSFASVEIMPEITNDEQIEIRQDEIRIDTYRSSGAGGQHVNKTDSAVRITHLPTNIVVSCQNERSQIQNKEMAFKMLRSKLVEKKERELLEKSKDIKGELKKIEWGSQIRSYVFAPYTMVKDHRTNFENADVESVIDGNIHDFVLDYLKKSQV
ncbi:MAG: peptide chain release factor 2 [Firmicutes bacterium]|nr:peptide chain release factor 2 [Bacillota bacterium]MCL1953985.1 peptide chain release factor 2 [Bacillota bacterium]